MNSKRFNDLLQRSLEGRLSDKETRELRQLLDENPEAVDIYLEHCQMEGWLSDPSFQVAVDEDKLIPINDQVRPSSEQDAVNGKSRYIIYALASAATVMLLLLVWPKQPPLPVESPGIARVIRVEGESAFPSGTNLQANTEIKMQSGLIELAFRDSGVHLVGSAPLHFTADSSMRIFLHEGEVKLHVPPQGIGFEVDTVDRKITDLGTSFVVSARPDDSKVLVLDGKIKISDRQKPGPDYYMREGDVASFDTAGAVQMRSTQSRDRKSVV